MNAYFTRTLTLLFILTLSFARPVQAQRFLIPDEAIMQYAGSIGYFSVGGGYELFKNKRGNLDINYGYVPESKGGELHIVTAKFAYRPFVIKISDWAKIYPFNPGVFVTYTFHKDLSFNFPSETYPKGYYYWSEAIRPHLSISNEFQFVGEEVLKKTGLKAVSIYSEFNTNDFYLVNYFQNSTALKITDIFKVGIGLRVKF
ncbi:hypothetical protein [Pedobacter metabolipauper]|uniref:Outer membrane protein with beta-barrel domain n=1 Tax=Pedobacter metabolipauper TaxID=425513 RepID=A0A4R6T2E7_9SPHI|nr:hypothetical protein [Pedobacter metabolipauper]TDQ11878.1 hypothetical protein ATK78_1008 [Pedobacter metabolipauper]